MNNIYDYMNMFINHEYYFCLCINDEVIMFVT